MIWKVLVSRFTRLFLQTRSATDQTPSTSHETGRLWECSLQLCFRWKEPQHCSAMPASTQDREERFLSEMTSWSKSKLARQSSIFQCFYPLWVSHLFSHPSIHLLNLGKNFTFCFLSLFAFSLLTSGLFWDEGLSAEKGHGTSNTAFSCPKLLLRCHSASFIRASNLPHYSFSVLFSLVCHWLDETTDLKSSCYSYSWSGLFHLQHCLQSGSSLRGECNTAQRCPSPRPVSGLLLGQEGRQ